MRRATSILIFLFLGLFPIAWAGKVIAEDLSVIYALQHPQIRQVFEAFAEQEGISMHIEQMDSNALKARFLLGAQHAVPDVILGPSDFIGIPSLHLTPVPPTLLPAQLNSSALETVVHKDEVKGVPILMGNHLVLFYDKSVVEQPVRTWSELTELHRESEQPVIGWSFHEMYWFAPFYHAFGVQLANDDKGSLQSPNFYRAMEFYWQQERLGLVDDMCPYQCSQSRFIEGRILYLIDGSWAYSTLYNQLGPKLGVAALPSINRQPMRSYYSSHALLRSDLLDQKKQHLVSKLTHYLLQEETQLKLWRITGELPVIESVLARVQHQADPNQAIIIDLLHQSRAVPNGLDMTIAWEAMLVGMKRYGAGVIELEQAGHLMEYLSNKTMQNMTNGRVQ